MFRSRDAVLAVTVLCIAIVFGWIADASARWWWAFAGAIAAVVAELLAYRRPNGVQSLFARPAASLLATTAAGIAVGAGAIVAPDRSLSLAVGALGTYCCMLAVVAVSGWTPATTEQD